MFKLESLYVMESDNAAECQEIVCLFFNDTATTEIYTLSLHDALPISSHQHLKLLKNHLLQKQHLKLWQQQLKKQHCQQQERSEEHTSELQSRQYLVCRLLLEKKNIRPAQGAAGLPLRRAELQDIRTDP